MKNTYDTVTIGLALLLIARNLIFADAVIDGLYNASGSLVWVMRAERMLARCFSQRISAIEQDKSLGRMLFFNFYRNLCTTIAGQLLKSGTLKFDVIAVCTILSCLITTLLQCLPKSFFHRTRYFWYWVVLEQRIFYAYDFVESRNSVVSNNTLMYSLVRWYIDSYGTMFPLLAEMLMYGKLALRQIPQIWYSYDEPYIQGLLAMILYQVIGLGSNLELNLASVGQSWLYAPNLYSGWQVTHPRSDYSVYAALYAIFAFNTIQMATQMNSRLQQVEAKVKRE